MGGRAPPASDDSDDHYLLTEGQPFYRHRMMCVTELMHRQQPIYRMWVVELMQVVVGRGGTDLN